MKRSNQVLKGLYAAATALTTYSVVLGLCVTLILLVVSMESGGSTIPQQSIELTQAIILLSQGSGFSAGSLTLTVIPLGLTVILIALLSASVKHFGISWEGFFSGFCFWLVASFVFQQIKSVVLVDTTIVIEAKTALVYCIAYSLAFLQHGVLNNYKKISFYKKLPDYLQHIINYSFKFVLRLIIVLLAIGCFTVIVWVFINHDVVSNLFILLNMGAGSRVFTTIASMAWLPNIIIWALSWISGGGFYIGELASFTLWTGQGEFLPPIPLFGLFPEAIGNPTQRMVLLLIPTIVIGIVTLRAFFRVNQLALIPELRKHGLNKLDSSLIFSFLYSFVGLVISWVSTMVLLWAFFFFSRGDLGSARLSGVGVHVDESLIVCGRSLIIGLFTPWLLMIISSVVIVFWHITLHYIRGGFSHPADDNHSFTSKNRAMSDKYFITKQQGTSVTIKRKIRSTSESSRMSNGDTSASKE